MLIVKKFGGTSVANKERIFNVAKRCIEDYKKGKLKLNTSNDYVSISEVEKTLKVPNLVELNSCQSFSVKSNNNQSEVSEPLQRRASLLTQSLRNSNIEDL